MPWYVKNHEALNYDDIAKATVDGAGASWEIRIWGQTAGRYVVHSTYTSEAAARYALNQSMGSLALKNPVAKGVASVENPNVYAFFEGCSLLAVRDDGGGQYAAVAAPTGEVNAANFLVLKAGTEQQCKDYLTTLFSQWMS